MSQKTNAARFLDQMEISFGRGAEHIDYTGGERRLSHSDGEAERFYPELKQRGSSVRVGMEATGYARWFERLLAELEYDLSIGNAADVRLPNDQAEAVMSFANPVKRMSSSTRGVMFTNSRMHKPWFTADIFSATIAPSPELSTKCTSLRSITVRPPSANSDLTVVFNSPALSASSLPWHLMVVTLLSRDWSADFSIWK